MSDWLKRLFVILALLAAPWVADKAVAATAAEIDAEVDAALAKLFRDVPAAKTVADNAVGVLVFPQIIKGGFGLGGEFGEGALRQGGRTTGYYNVASVSFGFQIGAQGYSNVLMFMTEEALKFLDDTKGFELGADAGFAVADVGAGGEISSNTVQSPIIAFVFGQKGLMGGVSIEGSKITKINK